MHEARINGVNESLNKCPKNHASVTHKGHPCSSFWIHRYLHKQDIWIVLLDCNIKDSVNWYSKLSDKK